MLYLRVTAQVALNFRSYEHNHRRFCALFTSFTKKNVNSTLSIKRRRLYALLLIVAYLLLSKMHIFLCFWRFLGVFLQWIQFSWMRCNMSTVLSDYTDKICCVVKICVMCYGVWIFILGMNTTHFRIFDISICSWVQRQFNKRVLWQLGFIYF